VTWGEGCEYCGRYGRPCGRHEAERPVRLMAEAEHEAWRLALRLARRSGSQGSAFRALGQAADASERQSWVAERRGHHEAAARYALVSELFDRAADVAGVLR
jgi:hypothetical protein